MISVFGISLTGVGTGVEEEEEVEVEVEEEEGGRICCSLVTGGGRGGSFGTTDSGGVCFDSSLGSASAFFDLEWCLLRSVLEEVLVLLEREVSGLLFVAVEDG